MAVKLFHGAGRATTVYYDDEACTYIKCFTRPKWYTKKAIKIALGIYKTPGEHTAYVTKKLCELGLHCPEIVRFEDYKVESKALQGMISLAMYREKHGYDAFREEQKDIFIRLTQAHITHKDPHDWNFFCDGKNIYIIDIDALSYSRMKFLPKQLSLYRLWMRSGKNDAFVYDIAAAWPKRNAWEKFMDLTFTVRMYLESSFKKDAQDKLAFVKHFNAYCKNLALGKE